MKAEHIIFIGACIGCLAWFLCELYRNKRMQLSRSEYRFLVKLQTIVLALFLIHAYAMMDDISYAYVPVGAAPPLAEVFSLAYWCRLLPGYHQLFGHILPDLAGAGISLIVLLHGRTLIAAGSRERQFAQTILDAIPDSIFVKNADHLFQAGNKACRQMMSRPEDILGKTGAEFFPSEQMEGFFEKDKLVLRDGITDISEEQVTLTDGKSITMLTTKVPLTLADGSRGLVGIARDITQQKQVEHELAMHRDHLEQMVKQQTEKIEKEKTVIALLQAAASLANKTQHLHLALQPFLALICRHMEWPAGHAFLFDPQDGMLFSSKIWYSEHPQQYAELKEQTGPLRFESGEEISGRVLESRKACWVNDTDWDDCLVRKDIMRRCGLKAAVAFPIFHQDNIVAVLEFFSEKPIRRDQDMPAMFNNIGTQLSVVIEREQTTEAMQMAVRAAEKADQLKSEFLANMSHELRTPMHSIITFSRQGIERAERWTKGEQAENLQLIKESGERLLGLLNNLLDLAKLEAQKVHYVFAPCDMQALVEKTLNQLHGLIEEKQLGIVRAFGDRLPEVMCDESKVMQLLTNLLGNAIKFTPAGKAIGIEGRLEEGEGGWFVLSISDEGIGIPPGEMGDIFDKFVQSSKTKSGAGGTGLGLAICKEIALHHKGAIWAENNLSGGAVFHLRLPVQ